MTSFSHNNVGTNGGRRVVTGVVACVAGILCVVDAALADTGAMINPGPEQAPTVTPTVQPGCDKNLAQISATNRQNAIAGEYKTNAPPPMPSLGQLSCLTSLLNSGSTLFFQVPNLASILSEIEAQACGALYTMWNNTVNQMGGAGSFLNGSGYNLGTIDGVNLGNVGANLSQGGGGGGIGAALNGQSPINVDTSSITNSLQYNGPTVSGVSSQMQGLGQNAVNSVTNMPANLGNMFNNAKNSVSNSVGQAQGAAQSIFGTGGK